MYNYKVIYRPGKSNIADPFSRLCQGNNECIQSYDEESERIVRLLSQDACPVALSLEDIIDATKQDSELSEFMRWMSYPLKRWPKTLSIYKRIAHDLSTDGKIILKNNRIVIPRALQMKILQLAHEPHLGCESMKKRLRQKVWWNRMDIMVQDYVKKCTGCTLVSEPDVEPMTRTILPAGPWRKLALDFTDINNGIHLLVVVDYFSRYPEIEIMTSTTAKATILKLRIMFSRFGYPEEIICDNGPPFASSEFVQFCVASGVKITHSIPYAPFQNGLVERHNRTLLKTVKISVAMQREWRNDLQDFLLAYRNTPHSTTNATPAMLMFGRNLKDKLPMINQAGNSNMDNESRTNDEIKKEKGKIYGDTKRRAKESRIDVGDHVVVKNLVKRSKLDTNFNPQPHIVVKKSGTRLTLRNLSTGVEYDRHVNHAKLLISSNPFDLKSPIFDEIISKTEDDQPENTEEEKEGTAESTRSLQSRQKRKPEYLKDYELYKIRKLQ